MREDLLNKSLNELEVIINGYNQPLYRAEQIFISLHKKFDTDISQITLLPLKFKQSLEQDFFVNKLILADLKESSADRTKKFLFRLSSGYMVETVLIIEKDRKTICVSTQAGCNVGCEFCATGKMGFKINLDASEIISQVYEIIRITGNKPTNIWEWVNLFSIMKT